MNTNIFEDIVNKILKEYSSDQRLPFDDDQFKNKNYLEQYTDWLEDFGKYGELPPSKLDFWTEVEKAIKYIIDNNLHGRYDLGLEDNDKQEILNELSFIIGDNLQFNKNGNLYIERNIVIGSSAEDYDNSDENGRDPKYMYRYLVREYQNNVGGCWSYKMNGSNSYCTTQNGDSITMRGYIRLEDIDFVKTVLLNFHYKNEHEIRVKPKAKVELFEVNFNCKYKIPLKGNLIVSATYFGNNGQYSGEYATVDDGFGNFRLMDREGNIISFDEYIEIINNKLSKGISPEDIFESVYKLKNGLTHVFFFKKHSYLNQDGQLIYGGKMWFDYADDSFDPLGKVKRGGKYSLIMDNGKLIGDGEYWFNNVDYANNYFYIVSKGVFLSLVTKDGKLIGNGKLWFNDVKFLRNGYARVAYDNKFNVINFNGDLISKIPFDDIKEFNNSFAEVELNGKVSFINENGKLIGNGKLWFDYAYSFREGFASICINNKWTWIDTNGKLLKNGTLWFQYVSNFKEGFAIVDDGNNFSFIDKNGNLIGNGKLWFDNVERFKNGYAIVEVNNNSYYIDTSGNFYDYETKESIPNPIGISNENRRYLKNIVKETLDIYLKNNLV